jgi:hypothetical protein
MITNQLWIRFDLGQAPVLRRGTVAWHVNMVMEKSTSSAGTQLLNEMRNDNIIEQVNDKWLFVRKTPARVRDVPRFSELMGICMQWASREEPGYECGLPARWQNLDRLSDVQAALQLIQVR